MDKKILKKIIPKFVLNIYYFLSAYLYALYYGFPSSKLIVIGITGTKGKTTTANFIWSVLQNSAIKTAVVTTSNIRIGNFEEVNKYHMTMPGRGIIQKFLSKMVREKCEVAIIETTSQGLEQWRHAGISYDVAIFTNLFPEHIESHGNFENYKNAKSKLFKTLSKSKHKEFRGKEFPKTIIANADSEYADFYLQFSADKKNKFSLKDVSEISDDANGVSFSFENRNYILGLKGGFNVINALPAIIIGKMFGIGDDLITNGIKNLKNIPGRMEEINEGQNFKVFVDYAHEGVSMNLAMESGQSMANGKKLIVLLGAEGGGRDKSKRSKMGSVVGNLADIVICSNVDPYEDDPFPIANEIAKSVEVEGKIRDKNLFVILDRREGIKKALSFATAGDVVMITGKGAEQSMTIAGKTIKWDDREVVREELKKFIA